MSEVIFKAPMDGYYQVAGKLFRSEPTGNMIEIKNPDREWYTFWLPETIMVNEFRTVEEWSGTEIRFLKKGQTVVGPGFKL